MKLHEFLKQFEGLDPESEVAVAWKHDYCDINIHHTLRSIAPTDHWEIFKIVKDDPTLKQVIVIY